MPQPSTHTVSSCDETGTRGRAPDSFFPTRACTSVSKPALPSMQPTPSFASCTARRNRGCLPESNADNTPCRVHEPIAFDLHAHTQKPSSREASAECNVDAPLLRSSLRSCSEHVAVHMVEREPLNPLMHGSAWARHLRCRPTERARHRDLHRHEHAILKLTLGECTCHRGGPRRAVRRHGHTTRRCVLRERTKSL